jgi:hypothetical protein
MSLTINVDRFTRLKQSVAGKFSPRDLPGLADYLAGDEGEISFSVSGNLVVDLSGGQVRRVTCIIYGWLLLFDPVTLLPLRHSLDMSSSLVLVKDESDLPPLEMESEGEDYIVCGINMDVAERIEEEILLSLPAHTVHRNETKDARDERTHSASSKSAKSAQVNQQPAEQGKKISPFAKLVELKKK